MNAKITFVFSGQGSQHYHMARSLLDHSPVFSRSMVQLDGMVRDLCGSSVIETLYSAERSKGELFARTRWTHPAIFMVEYSLARSLIEAGVVPDIVVGASLGSFAAAAIAGCLGVEEALAAVVRQAVAIEAHCPPGGMTAVLGDPRLLLPALEEFGELAAVNFASHFVMAAPTAALEHIERHLHRRSAGYQRLPVSHAFHSRWIDEAQRPFEALMRSSRLCDSHLPLVCCDRIGTITKLTHEDFWRVARHPIRTSETIAWLEHDQPHHYVDVGPAGTFATFLKYSLPPTSRSSIHAILSPFSGDERRLGDVCAKLGRAMKSAS